MTDEFDDGPVPEDVRKPIPVSPVDGRVDLTFAARRNLETCAAPHCGQVADLEVLMAEEDGGEAFPIGFCAPCAEPLLLGDVA